MATPLDSMVAALSSGGATPTAPTPGMLATPPPALAQTGGQAPLNPGMLNQMQQSQPMAPGGPSIMQQLVAANAQQPSMGPTPINAAMQGAANLPMPPPNPMPTGN